VGFAELVLVTLASSTTRVRAFVPVQVTTATGPTCPVDTDLFATTTFLIWAA
jgi:hypothetical protein